MILAVTGHRPQRLKNQESLIKKWAINQLKILKPDKVYIGMAQGADQIIGLAAKELKISLVCCYAYPKKYFHPIEEYLMENNEVIFVSPKYSKQSYIIRDFFMVDSADILLCVWDGIGGGGTFITRNYAISKGKNIIDYGGLMAHD